MSFQEQLPRQRHYILDLILISVIGPERLGRRFDTEEAPEMVDALAVPEGLDLEKANVKHQS